MKIESAAILSVGTELTRGEIQNTNTTWLADALTALGTTVRGCESIADVPQHISEALLRLAEDCDLLICTGGLGPTSDDLTSAAVADSLGVDLVRDPIALAAIEKRYESRGRSLTSLNSKQADFPRDATILENANGTAPGFSVVIGSCHCFFFPGVPREMKPMFDIHVRPLVQKRRAGGVFQARLNTYGAGESTIANLLGGIEERFGVVLGYRAHFPEVIVKVLARRTTDALAKQAAGECVTEVRKRLQEFVYSEGSKEMAEVVLSLLSQHGLTLSTAESCTGGLVAKLLTDVPGSSSSFAGSIVAYSNEVKTRTLGVPVALLEASGAVSEPVVRAMAEGAQQSFKTGVAISISGIAGPGGGTEAKPVGLVHYAVSVGTHTRAQSAIFRGDRARIRRAAAYAALNCLRVELLQKQAPKAPAGEMP